MPPSRSRPLSVWGRVAAAGTSAAIRPRSMSSRTSSSLGMWRKLAFDSIAAVQAGRDPHGIVRADGGNDVIRFDAGKNFSDHTKSPVAAS